MTMDHTIKLLLAVIAAGLLVTAWDALNRRVIEPGDGQHVWVTDVRGNTTVFAGNKVVVRFAIVQCDEVKRPTSNLKIHKVETTNCRPVTPTPSVHRIESSS